MAEGVGFEPTTPVSQGKRLAGARTRPLCDPSIVKANTIVFYSVCFDNMYTLPSRHREVMVYGERRLRLFSADNL